MCNCNLVRKFVILLNSWQLRECLVWLNGFFRNTFPRDDARSGSPIVICPKTGIIAGSLLGLLTGHLRYICLNRQVMHKCLLSCTKCVICGGVRAERCFHTPPPPAAWITLVAWKGLPPYPHPAPNSWDHPGPSTYSFHHRVLSMKSGCGCPSCGVWPPHWRPLTSNARICPKSFYVLLLLTQLTCSECAFVHSSFSVYRISSAEWALWAAWHAKACVCPLRKAWNICGCLTVPITSVPFPIFPPHQFQTNSLLDTKKMMNLAWSLTWSQSMCAHPCLAPVGHMSWCLTDSKTYSLDSGGTTIGAPVWATGCCSRPITFPPSTIST